MFRSNMHRQTCPKEIQLLIPVRTFANGERRQRLIEQLIDFGMVRFELIFYTHFGIALTLRNRV